MSTPQKVGIWLTVVPLFFWAYTLVLAALNLWFGLAFVPFSASGEPVIESGNLLLYSRLERHLTNIKPSDYVVVDGRSATATLLSRFGYEGIALQIGTTFVGRVKGFHKDVNGEGLVIVEVPMLLGGQAFWRQTVVPANSV